MRRSSSVLLVAVLTALLVVPSAAALAAGGDTPVTDPDKDLDQAPDKPDDDHDKPDDEQAGSAPPSSFADISGNRHEGMILAVVAAGITRGCDADGTRFCPARAVTRGQLATFLATSLNLPAARSAGFGDTATSTHARSIDRVVAAGIASGISDDRFAPERHVTREQLATFLANAFELPPASGHRFLDLGSSPHADAIARVAAAGITTGCTGDGKRFCPGDAVRRDQLATFLGGSLGLAPKDPPPADPPATDPTDPRPRVVQPWPGMKLSLPGDGAGALWTSFRELGSPDELKASLKDSAGTYLLIECATGSVDAALDAARSRLTADGAVGPQRIDVIGADAAAWYAYPDPARGRTVAEVVVDIGPHHLTITYVRDDRDVGAPDLTAFTDHVVGKLAFDRDRFLAGW